MGMMGMAENRNVASHPGTSLGPIYKISYDLSQDYLEFIVRSFYDSDLQGAKISLRNIIS